ncbi:hypothetical protein PPL_05213 [Heterostelium album PN500]|uniref:Uncharacterized protein n=1 Tax=Heterostelium pallidum (strain ATCC 26659 / Pp 5 / PN500) TaxID=670386 RepID=D3B9R7_HETP5|nr:hypothetical protein PPL_05213 [Heterostelium album PN500]EFA81979.1 hypothetical protein PPL_05213 [Heterostelium album PN500]|eukprot:XP_020434096.1 hypothetical protein PPL_05213 [Heterostelium album PN500]
MIKRLYLSSMNHKETETTNSKHWKVRLSIWCLKLSLIDKKIFEILSESVCRYHNDRWNPLTLSLVSHYWLVEIISKSQPRITTLSNEVEFLVGLPQSYYRSYAKLYDNVQTTDIPVFNMKLTKLTIISLDHEKKIKKSRKKMSKDYYDRWLNRRDWITQYNDALLSLWSFDSLTVIGLFEGQQLDQLLIANRLRKLRVYHDTANEFHLESFPNLTKYTIRHDKEEWSLEESATDIFFMPNHNQSLTSLVINIPFNRNHPLDQDAQPMPNVTSLELNNQNGFGPWSNRVQERIPLNIAHYFPNLTTLSLDNIYHLMVYSSKDEMNTLPLPVLIGKLKQLRHLSINNKRPSGLSKIDKTLGVYPRYYSEFETGETAQLFARDLLEIGGQLHTLKLKGEVTLFSPLLSQSLSSLTNLKRLSTSHVLTMDDVNLLTLLNSSLKRVSANFYKHKNNALLHIIKNNKNIVVIKDYSFDGYPTAELFNALSDGDTKLEKLQLVCDNDMVPKTKCSNLSVHISMVNRNKHKQPRHQNKEQYQHYRKLMYFGNQEDVHDNEDQSESIE